MCVCVCGGGGAYGRWDVGMWEFESRWVGVNWGWRKWVWVGGMERVNVDGGGG